MKIKRFSGYISVLLALFTLCVSAAPAFAADVPYSSSGLSITPRKNYTIEAGKTVNDKLSIGNLDSKADLNISLKMIDFTFMNQGGTPKLNLAEDAPQTTWSLKPYTTLPKSIVVPAGSTKTVEFSIKIPANLGAGSYYSAIQYASGNGEGGNVNLGASGVSLVFVSVPGIVKEDMQLKKLGAYQSESGLTGGSYVFIALNEPKEIAYTLQNSGNVVESPVASATVKSMFGKTYTVENANKTSSLALIGQTRLFKSCIVTAEEEVKFRSNTAVKTECESPKLWPGRYSINFSAYYGQNGNATREVAGTASFWYLPAWFLIAVVVAILLIAYAVLKVRNKWRARMYGNTYRRRR